MPSRTVAKAGLFYKGLASFVRKLSGFNKIKYKFCVNLYLISSTAREGIVICVKYYIYWLQMFITFVPQ